MADKSIKITIATALNAAGFTAARRALSSLVNGTKAFAAKVGSNLMNVKAGFDMIVAAASKFMTLMTKGMEFERMTVTFKTLTGSLELAKAHMKDLQDLGRTPPFSLEAFAGASQMMMKMTDGMLGYKKSLEMVGDIAAATGNDINAVARSVGLAYQMLRDGQPFGRAGSQMVQLGILTKAQVEHFDNLSKAGGDNMALWNELTQTLGKYKGAMADTEKTTKGMIEAIQGEATVAMTDFSSAITENAKPALEGLLFYLRRINEDGTIEDWADSAVAALGSFGNAIRSIYNLWKGSLGTVFAFARGADKAFHEGKWYDIRGQIRAGKESAMRYYNGEDEDPAVAAKKQQRAADRAKQRAQTAAKAEADARKRIETDMANAQAETNRKKEDAELDAYIKRKREEEEEANRFIRAYEEEEVKAEKAAAKEELEVRRDTIRQLHDERMRQLDAEQARVQKLIDAAKSSGYDNVMRTAGGGYWGKGTLDQKGEERARHQRIVDAKRAADAEFTLREKMAAKGATLDDPTKLGRMSNLERAAFENMKLKRDEKELLKIQKEKIAREQQIVKDLDDINKRLQDVGL